jgi:predicted MFS family arabinose efflux permease
MKRILAGYKQVESHIYALMFAQFSVQLINAAFGMLRNYFMLEKGYKDFEIAGFTAYNYIAITLIAFPLGLFIKGKKLKPIFSVAIAALPFIAMLEIYAIDHHADILIKFAMICWGLAFACISASATPYMLLNAKKETHSEVMALGFQTYTIATILIGLVHYLLKHFFPEYINDRNFLYGISVVGIINMFFLWKIKFKEKTSEPIPLKEAHKAYDWPIIAAALVPTTIIAIGAGLTIQFINLFFENVHHMNSDNFALMVSGTYVLVALGTLVIPSVKRKFGYHFAVTGVQLCGVFMLIGLAGTEWLKDFSWALPLAIFFFSVRQPLMNVAGPVTSELTMYYVGEKNRELVSSLTASIWSGSWFFSAKIFEVLRSSGTRYGYILLTTAAMYLVAIYAYRLLIKSYYKRLELGIIKND